MGVLSRVAEADLLSRFAEVDVLEQLYEHRLAAVALVGVGVWVLRKLRAYWRLRRFKGPRGTGFFGLWHCRAILSYRSHKKYKEVVDTYGMSSLRACSRLLLCLLAGEKVPRRADKRLGPIARVGPNSLLTSDPELWMHMSSVRSSYSRAPWFVRATRFQAGKDHVFSQTDEQKHKIRRQQMAPGVRPPHPSPLPLFPARNPPPLLPGETPLVTVPNR